MWAYLVAGIVGALAGGAVVAAVMMARQTRLSTDRAALQAALTAADRAAGEQKALLHDSQVQVREAFSALSHEALRQNRQDFLQNAGALLQPLRDTLGKVQDQLATV